MPPNHAPENLNVAGSANETLPGLLTNLLPLPLFFAAFLLGFGFQAPWGVAAGLAVYRGLAAWAGAIWVWRTARAFR